MLCNENNRNICMVVTSLSLVMIFYLVSLIYIQSSIMGKDSGDLLRERLMKEQKRS